MKINRSIPCTCTNDRKGATTNCRKSDGRKNSLLVAKDRSLCQLMSAVRVNDSDTLFHISPRDHQSVVV